MPDKKTKNKIQDLVEKKAKLTTIKKEKEKKEGEEEYKTRKQVFEETGEIKIYPTEMSFGFTIGDSNLTEGSCQRKVFYDFFELPKTDESGVTLEETYRLGYCIEEIVKDNLKAMGELKEEEHKIELEIGDAKISGRIDAVLNDETMIEIKSHKSHPYTVDLLTGAKGAHKNGMMMRSHIPQAATYLTIKKILEPDVQHKFLMWYKDRNTLKDVLFELRLNESGQLLCNDQIVPRFNVLKMMSNLNELAGYIKEKKLPPRTYGKIKTKDVQALLSTKDMLNYRDATKINNGGEVLYFACNYCNYKTLCLNSGDE